MTDELTPAEVATVTGKKRPSAQAAEQWERASNALDADAEIDAMRRGE